MTILCLDCSTGISGDMTVAALLDLGANQKKLINVLASLQDQRFRVEIKKVLKSGLEMTDFNVILQAENHDHDINYLHGHESVEQGAISQETTHEHSDHGHSHSHAHEHRGLLDIGLLIEKTTASDKAKALAFNIFKILAGAEAKAHGKPIAQVHFHEVGALDSIVDILSVAVCLDDLGVDQVLVRHLTEGYGTIRCQHGILPIPVPAVANILSDYQLKVKFCDINGELITPTGAAILATLDSQQQVQNDGFCIKKVGMGAGKRSYSRPTFLRAMLLEKETTSPTHDEIVQLETNIDDCNGEVLGLVCDRLLTAHALDVSYCPIFMKKNRPGYLLRVICKESDRTHLEKIIFKETTTIGIRRQTMQRTLLPREIKSVCTNLGPICVKCCRLTDNGEIHQFYYPEYESVKKLAQEHHLPFKEVFNLTLKACYEQF